MSKIFALYRNELLKNFKKTSVIVIAIIMAALIILMTLGIKLVYNISNDYLSESSSVTEMKNEAQNELDRQLAEYSESEVDLSSDYDARDYIVYLTSDLYFYEYLEEYSLSYTDDCYMTDLLRSLSGLRAQEMYPFEGIKSSADEISLLEGVLENGDYGDYLSYLSDTAKDTMNLDKEQGEIVDEVYALLLKADPNGNDSYDTYSSAANTLIYNRLALTELDSGKGYSVYSQPMSEEEEKTLRDDTLLLEYRIENGSLASSDDESPRAISDLLTFSVGLTMVIILMIILSGSSVSSEMSTGSIKSLIIAPVKRWKIFTAKIAALVTVSIAAMIFMFLVRIGSSALIFGSDGVSPYLFVSGGEVRSFGYFIYNFFSTMVDYLNVLVFVFFSFMLSVITRNTGASVGLSIGMYFGIMELSEFVSLISNAEWTHFLPSMNLSLSSRVFTGSAASSLMMSAGVSINYPSIVFSLIYLAVASVMMLYTAFDSFTRRDI